MPLLLLSRNKPYRSMRPVSHRGVKTSDEALMVLIVFSFISKRKLGEGLHGVCKKPCGGQIEFWNVLQSPIMEDIPPV